MEKLPATFEEYLARFAGFIRGICYQNTANFHDVEEASQEASLLVWEAWEANQACQCAPHHPNRLCRTESHVRSGIRWRMSDYFQKDPHRKYCRTWTEAEVERNDRYGTHALNAGKRTDNYIIAEPGPSVAYTRMLSRHAQVRELALQGKTRQQIADATGYSKRHVQRILNGTG